MSRKIFTFISVFSFLTLAVPGTVILHALDHAVDFHLSHSHDFGTQPDAQHHDSDHDHQRIFSLTEAPSVLPNAHARLDRPILESVDTGCALDGQLNEPLNKSFISRQSADPPLKSQDLLTSSLTDKAPPA